jgi:hypothetical protein
VNSVSDTPRYVPICLGYALIYLRYILYVFNTPRYVPIRFGYNLISSFFFILFTFNKNYRGSFSFFIITNKITNPSQILQFFLIIIKQVIFYILYKNIFIIIYSRTSILYFLIFPYRRTYTVSDTIPAPPLVQHRTILILVPIDKRLLLEFSSSMSI